MDYFHKGDKQITEQSVKEFCQDVIRKNYYEFVKAKRFPREVLERMGELYFLGAMIPEEYGGARMSMSDYCVLMESLACYGGGSIALTLTAHHSLAVSHIINAGTEEQKNRFLPKLANGQMVAAWCLTEPQAGSDIFRQMKTTATLTDNGWLINGTKHLITNGTIANVYVVIAKIISGDPSQNSLGVFIVPKHRNFGEGTIYSRPETKMGMHASDTAQVTFQNIRIGADMKMEGDGAETTLKVLNDGRVGISALACGLLRSALNEAVAYAKERKSGGRPIIEYQLVSSRLTDASSKLACLWAMVEKAALACDEGKLTPKFAAETKYHVTENVVAGCFDVLRTFGGEGYMDHNRATHDYLDSVLLVIGEGTSDIQLLTIAKFL